MNYDHFNELNEYWIEKIKPLTEIKFNVGSFSSYLNQIGFLPTFKWLKSPDSCFITSHTLAISPEEYLQKYKNKIVTSYKPIKAEEGFQRFIHQISSTLHVESVMWAWVENNNVNSYLSTVICYKDKNEFDKFLKELWNMRRTGDSQSRENVGFAGTK